MQTKQWITYGAILAVGVLSAWYWFIDEPDDPFAVPEQKQILADPKVPPDPERPAASPAATKAAKPSGAPETASGQAKCAPGDPMCGEL